MDLYIIRHGETADNAKRICQGQGGGSLSDTGFEQAKKLGKRFEDISLDFVYASDLLRAVQTAEYLVESKESLPILEDKRLRERFFGQLQGKVFPKDFDWHNMPDDAESHEEMIARGKSILSELKAKHAGETVALVSHGGMILALLTILYKNGVEEYLKFKGVKNTAVFHFKLNGNQDIEEVLFNDVAHLS